MSTIVLVKTLRSFQVIVHVQCIPQKKCEEYWPVNVGESVEPGQGLTIKLTSVLPFAEYSLRKMTLTCVRFHSLCS